MTEIINGIAVTHLNPNAGRASGRYASMERLRAYLYKVTFDSIPQDDGGDNPVAGGGCSAYVKDGKLYRNYDFKYDNAASFIVRTRDFEGMSMITGLDDGALDAGLIAQLPYRVVDGINNHGIMVSTHILFNDWEWKGAGDRSISLTRLPYHVLSRVKSMATIAADLADVLGNLYVTGAMGDYLLQLLITDGTTTYALIPPTSDNQSYELANATAHPKMSNFRYVSRAEAAREDMDLQTRPTGIERFNAMPCPLADLRFTKAYESDERLSEFIGIGGTTKESTDEDLEAIYNLARAAYLDRTRDGQTWQTMHSVVYGNRMERLYIQENWGDNCIGGGMSSDDIVDNLESVAADKALSANQGRVLNELIAAISGLGKYLAIWDCTTGLATSTPPVVPYSYENGMFFIVGKVSENVNYIPSGVQYDGTPSTAIYSGTEELKAGDVYRYDGTSWSHMVMRQAGYDADAVHKTADALTPSEVSQVLLNLGWQVVENTGIDVNGTSHTWYSIEKI